VLFRSALDRILSNRVLNGASVEFKMKKAFQVWARMRESGKWLGN